MMHEAGGLGAWQMALVAMYGLALWGLAVTGIVVLVTQLSHPHRDQPTRRPWI